MAIKKTGIVGGVSRIPDTLRGAMAAVCAMSRVIYNPSQGALEAAIGLRVFGRPWNEEEFKNKRRDPPFARLREEVALRQQRSDEGSLQLVLFCFFNAIAPDVRSLIRPSATFSRKRETENRGTAR